MLTKTFALLHRGLRYDARVLKVHLMRVGMVVIVVGMLFFTHLESMMMGSPGLSFFREITWVTFVFATLACGALFATSITEEKEEQTLGLLAMANISSLSLITGKFLPRLVGALLLLSVLFPFTLLSITLGGVTWGQVWAAYWTLFAHVVLIGTMGLFCSVIFRRSSFAVLMTMVGVAAFLVVPGIIHLTLSTLVTSGVLPAAARIQQFSAAAVQTSAVPRIVDIMQTGFDEGPIGLQVASNLIGAMLLFCGSWALFAPLNRPNESATESASWFGRGARLTRASRRPWRRPVVWKDFHYLVGGPAGWAVRAVLYVGLAGVIGFAINGFRFDADLRLSVGYALMATTAATAALELLLSATYLFPAEVRNGTWPGLAMLPGSIARVAYGKVCGACLGLVPAALCFAAGGVLAMETAGELADWDGMLGLTLVFFFPTLIWYAVLLHLVVMYSLVLNQWAAIPLALLTMFIANCFMGPILWWPMMLVSVAGDGDFAAMVMGMVMTAVYGIVAAGICFGIEVIIGQRLRILAGR